jgi:F0F1-type ATP synthase membrane subunit b/b'
MIGQILAFMLYGGLIIVLIASLVGLALVLWRYGFSPHAPLNDALDKRRIVVDQNRADARKRAYSNFASGQWSMDVLNERLATIEAEHAKEAAEIETIARTAKKRTPPKP